MGCVTPGRLGFILGFLAVLLWTEGGEVGTPWSTLHSGCVSRQLCLGALVR